MRLIGVLVVFSSVMFGFGAPSSAADGDGEIETIATTGTPGDPPPPPPECWWAPMPVSDDVLNDWRSFWRTIDGGLHVDDVLIYVEGGTIRQTSVSAQLTYVLQVRVCDDVTDPSHGADRWQPVGPPNPVSLWEELTERVTRRVPAPAWDLGMSVDAATGRVDVVVNLGLWISVSNGDDVVARAEPAAGVWSEARASLARIEFDPGNGAPVVVCAGAGSVLPEGFDGVEEGPCGYTYRDYADLGERTATVRAVWNVTTSASTGDTGVRPDIVLQASIPIDVIEIQTVGG